MKIIFLSIISCFVLFFGCSSSQETAKDGASVQADSVYVFDEVPQIIEPEEPKPQPPVSPSSTVKTIKFVVQIGAFSSQDKADEYAAMSRKKLNKEIVVRYGQDVGLWVVQLAPFQTRVEAEKARNNLWKIKEFTDSFIVTVEN